MYVYTMSNGDSEADQAKRDRRVARRVSFSELDLKSSGLVISHRNEQINDNYGAFMSYLILKEYSCSSLSQVASCGLSEFVYRKHHSILLCFSMTQMLCSPSMQYTDISNQQKLHIEKTTKTLVYQCILYLNNKSFVKKHGCPVDIYQ